MPEEPMNPKGLFEWLQTKTGALASTFLAILIAAVSTFLQEELGARGMSIAAACLLCVTLLVIWTAAATTTRLRAKISKLEGEVHSLLVRPSPALKEISESDKVLVEVYRDGSAYERFSEIVGLSQIRVDDCLRRLKEDGLIEFHLGGAWASNSSYALTDFGRSYLLENHLVE